MAVSRLSDRYGWVNGALDLTFRGEADPTDLSDGHVAVSAGIGNMPTREHTVEAWVRLEGVNDWSGPVSFGQDDGCVLCPNVIAASFAGGHII